MMFDQAVIATDQRCPASFIFFMLTGPAQAASEFGFITPC